MDTEKTLVIFRKYKNKDPPFYNDIVALFPEIKEYHPGTCLCYEHIGQHGSADYNYVMMITKKANPDEYNDLKTELESIGYNLKIKQKWIRGRKRNV